MEKKPEIKPDIVTTASFILGIRRTRVFREVCSGTSDLPILLKRVCGYQPHDRGKMKRAMKKSRLFEIDGNTCTLSELGGKVGKICNDYGLFRGYQGILSDKYFIMMLGLGTSEFSIWDLGRLSSTSSRTVMHGFKERDWILEVRRGVYTFNRKGLAAQMAIATMWADIDESKAHLMVVADGLRQELEGNGAVHDINEIESQLAGLEGTRSRHLTRIATLEGRKAEQIQQMKKMLEKGRDAVNRKITALKGEIADLEKQIADNKEKEAELVKKVEELEVRLVGLGEEWKEEREKISEDVPKEEQTETDLMLFGHSLDVNAEWAFHALDAAYTRFFDGQTSTSAAQLTLTHTEDELKLVGTLAANGLFGIEKVGSATKYAPTRYAIGIMMLYRIQRKDKQITRSELLTLLSDPELTELKKKVDSERRYLRVKLGLLLGDRLLLEKYADWKDKYWA